MLLKRTQGFLRELHRIGAVKIDTKDRFRLALHDTNPKAPLSPFYINLRTPDNKEGPLQQTHVETIASELVAVASRLKMKYDAVAGIPRAGTPFAEAIVRGERQGYPYISLKKVGRGRDMRVDSPPASGSDGRRLRVLLVDDLITGADTKWNAIKALRDANHEVSGIAVYLDREQGGAQNLIDSGIPLASVVKFSEVLSFYEETKLIRIKDAKAIRAYLNN